VDHAEAVPRPAKPARQNLRTISGSRRAPGRVASVTRSGSGKSAAPASPAAARRRPCPPGGTLALP